MRIFVRHATTLSHAFVFVPADVAVRVWHKGVAIGPVKVYRLQDWHFAGCMGVDLVARTANLKTDSIVWPIGFAVLICQHRFVKLGFRKESEPLWRDLSCAGVMNALLHSSSYLQKQAKCATNKRNTFGGATPWRSLLFVFCCPPLQYFAICIACGLIHFQTLPVELGLELDPVQAQHVQDTLHHVHAHEHSEGDHEPHCKQDVAHADVVGERHAHAREERLLEEHK